MADECHGEIIGSKARIGVIRRCRPCVVKRCTQHVERKAAEPKPPMMGEHRYSPRYLRCGRYGPTPPELPPSLAVTSIYHRTGTVSCARPHSRLWSTLTHTQSARAFASPAARNRLTAAGRSTCVHAVSARRACHHAHDGL